MILQIELPTVVTESFIGKWGAYGAFLILLILLIIVLIRYIKTQEKLKTERLVKDKESLTQKNEILYNEIQDMRKEQIDRYAELKIKDNEIQKEMVLALKNNTNAFNNHTVVFNKLIEKL